MYDKVPFIYIFNYFLCVKNMSYIELNIPLKDRIRIIEFATRSDRY